MSVWKKAAKANQKTHRERHQPELRKHLGLLEKKKDYVQRATDFNTKKTTLKVLRKRALNKNPDEFYHHMINSQITDGKHIEKEDSEDEDTPDQLKFKRSEDLKYIRFKRTQELKKIERMQAELHMTNVLNGHLNKRIVFPKNLEGEDQGDEKNLNKMNALASKELPDVDLHKLEQAAKKKRSVYRELGKRVERERELAVIQQKLEVARRVESGKHLLKPKKVKKGTKESAPVYKFQYERKK
ncbi:probable U3 small nucleolar RNA-associated protein 11 [Atheta coriaria]|uniref:probable U3 small nucleolar RNA-associated protein 11 n=1 Tax=Dalotia coriaria TaxID=877792 RepID=UPI0031F37903